MHVICKIDLDTVLHMQVELVKVSCGKCTEDADGDSGHDQSTSHGLEEYCILDLAKRRLLDPDLAIKDLPKDIALFVFGDPGFVFVAIGATHSFKGTLAHFELGVVVIFGEEFPGSQMSVVHAVKDLYYVRGFFFAQMISLRNAYDAHALPSTDQGCNAKHEANCGEYSVATAGIA